MINLTSTEMLNRAMSLFFVIIDFERVRSSRQDIILVIYFTYMTCETNILNFIPIFKRKNQCFLTILINNYL